MGDVGEREGGGGELWRGVGDEEHEPIMSVPLGGRSWTVKEVADLNGMLTAACPPLPDLPSRSAS